MRHGNSPKIVRMPKAIILAQFASERIFSNLSAEILFCFLDLIDRVDGVGGKPVGSWLRKEMCLTEVFPRLLSLIFSVCAA
jgi:hypothetical protein